MERPKKEWVVSTKEREFIKEQAKLAVEGPEGTQTDRVDYKKRTGKILQCLKK